MIFNDYTTAKEFIRTTDFISAEDSFSLGKLCAKLLRTNEEEKFGRDLAIRIRDAWENEKLEVSTISMWNDILDSAGLFPYVDPNRLSTSALLRYEYHRSPNLHGIYLHSEQHELTLELLRQKAVVVSAPTSFGKSLLIEEVIASKKYKNIVIIQPTLALIDETRKKLSKYKESYKVLVSTSQEPSSDLGNIFLFTGERVVEYTKFPPIDFFVIDEFYKLSIDRDDDRAITLNQAFHKLLAFTNRFYLLGPMIKSIPTSFKEKFDLKWFPTDFATVAVDELQVEVKGKLRSKERNEDKKLKLFQLLSNTSESTIVYCSSPAKATELGFDFLYYKKMDGEKLWSDENRKIIEWVKENVNPDWSLNDLLKDKIAFHHGALPRHLGSSIVDAFNAGAIQYLFCTSTLIEGVNTTAKNIILFDKKKGGKEIDFFDYKNIAGRSGRMKKHFIGRVYKLEEQPQQYELELDIPLFSQENAPLEVLIFLNDHEIQPEVRNRLESFLGLPPEIQQLLRLNPSISLDGQIQIINEIESNLHFYHGRLKWVNTPNNFDELSTVIELGWNYLAKDEEKRLFISGIGKLSARWLTSFTFAYINQKSLRRVIAQFVNDNFWKDKIKDEKLRVNTAAFYILYIGRHWFDYKLPKWLSVISGLQDYVFKKNNLSAGSYLYLASNLEHGFMPPNLAALLEYDIPSSAISKLGNFLNEHKTPEQNIINLKQLSSERFKQLGLIDYEIDKICNAL